MRSTLHDERGVVALIVAIIMVVMIGMSAMAIDFGFWWTSQRHLQTQADAGALAGADHSCKTPLVDCPSFSW
jgi:Flp pilus assembly protein TadG